MLSQIQKHKKKFIYALALIFGVTGTTIMVNKDEQDSSDTAYTIINKANADTPYYQSNYYRQGSYTGGYGDDGDGDGDDTGGYGDDTGGYGDDSSDEMT